MNLNCLRVIEPLKFNLTLFNNHMQRLPSAHNKEIKTERACEVCF